MQVSSIVTVHSDIGGGVVTEEVPADPKPHVHLLPASGGLKVAVLARPFAQGGPYYRPVQVAKRSSQRLRASACKRRAT
jgi:hypothetical protein